jgi:pentatricopeptide repeat protein
MNVLATVSRPYLLRDAYEDMLLDGVQPVRDTFHNLIVGTMKGSRLQDAFYFRDQMREMGLQPDVRPLSSSHPFIFSYGKFLFFFVAGPVSVRP